MSRHLSCFQGAAALIALTTAANANSVDLFGTHWQVQRFDYKQSIQWTNPVAPGNQQGLIRVEGAYWIGNNHMLVSTSHQDQSVPTTYANFILEIRADTDANGSVTGMSYVRTVVENDPLLLSSPFDLRAGGVAVNPTGVGVGSGGNVLAADGGSSKMLRAYDILTGALLPAGPSGLGVPMSPPMTDFTDLTYYTEGPRAGHRLFALDEIALKVYACDLDGVPLSNFSVGGAVNPAALPGDPKGIAYLSDTTVWPTMFQGKGGIVLISMGDKQPGLQAFKRDGTEVGWEPLSSAVFLTSPTVSKPKIEAVVADPVMGRLFLFMEKGSLVDNWVWVLTPDCNQNTIADVVDIQNAVESDVNLDGKPDVCQDLGTLTCVGDGTGTACPCANESLVGDGRGCLNATGAGARLRAFGTSSLTNDTIHLTGELMPNGPVLYAQATVATNGGSGIQFGDGLLCLSGTVTRLRIQFNSGGASSIPVPGDLSISVNGLVAGPGTYVYQAWYRDTNAFCTGAGFNLSNGLSLTWTP